jgi:hypothetical protein
MNNDQHLIAEAYSRIYLKVDEDFHDHPSALERAESVHGDDTSEDQKDVNQIEHDEKIFRYQTGTKYIRVTYKPEGYDKTISAYGEIMKIIEPGKVLVRMRSGPDQVNQSGPNSSVVPNDFGSKGKDFVFDYTIKYFPKRGPKVEFPTQDGKQISDIGSSVNAGSIRLYKSIANTLKEKK